MSDPTTRTAGDPRVIEEYVGEVLSLLPPAVPGVHRVGADLRAHLREAAEAGGSAGDAVREMGPPERAAEGYAEGLDLEPASLADRTGAFLVDVGLGVTLSATLFLLTAGGAAALDLRLGAAPVTVVPLLLVGLGALLSILYFPALETLYGQTLGKRLFGLCVARENGLRAELWRTVVRRLPLFFEFFLLDAAFAPFTGKRQRAFDMVAGTVVVPGTERGGRTVGWIVAALLWLAPLLAVAAVSTANRAGI